MLTQTRITLIGVLIALAFIALPLPARADFGVSLRVAVGSVPPPPPSNVASSSDSGYSEPCGDKRLQWIVYGAQLFNAFVASNAVRRGAVGATIFGTSKSVAPYAGELAVEDATARFFTRRWTCRARSLTLGVLGASALINTGNTDFPRTGLSEVPHQ